jgi:hypothetical protein
MVGPVGVVDVALLVFIVMCVIVRCENFEVFEFLCFGVKTELRCYPRWDVIFNIGIL